MAKTNKASIVTNLANKEKHSKKPRSGSAHTSLKPIIFLAQICSIFPVNGTSDLKKISFTWKSWRVFYFAAILSGFVFCAVLSTKKALNSRIVLQQLISPLFYISCVAVSMASLRLAKKWPKFVKNWNAVEKHMDNFYSVCPKLRKRIRFITVLAVAIILVERCLITLNFIYSKNCENSFRGAEYYFKKQFHFFFHYYEYNLFSACLLLILSWIGAYVWNFADLLIILLSIIFAARLEQFSKRIEIYLLEIKAPCMLEGNLKYIKVFPMDVNVETRDSKIWKRMREDYDKLTEMCHDLDDLLSDLVIVSYSSNLTFILVQLFMSLRQIDSVIEGVYFFYSFGFIIVRTVVVSIYGSMVNEQSLAPLPLLHSIPSEAYNNEIQRLMTQIQMDTVALTGHNFYRITKGLVLNVAAAIITYELVLIQFNQATLEKYSSSVNVTICY